MCTDTVCDYKLTIQETKTFCSPGIFVEPEFAQINAAVIQVLHMHFLCVSLLLVKTSNLDLFFRGHRRDPFCYFTIVKHSR